MVRDNVRLSAFNLYVSDFPTPGTTLIHNTFSGGFVEVEDDVLEVLRRADRGADLSSAEQALVDPALFDRDVGVLVEDRAAEEKAFRAWYEARRSQTDTLDAIVSVTFACNLDCTYCCQADVLDGTTMKLEAAAETGRWLGRRALEIGARRITLSFVGGEPLLHPDRIERVLAEARDVTGDLVDITFKLITNGVFLTRSLVERWVPLGLTGAQVTLDGDESTHSLTRRSKKKGQDSFATIFQNVVDTCGLIAININGNYQDDTAHGFVPLIQRLRAAGFPRGARVHFSPALAALGAPSDAGYSACNFSGSRPELMIAFGDEVRRNGFTATDPLAVGPCELHMRHHYSIDPQGHVYKCPGFLGKTEWAVGHVATGLTPRWERLASMNPMRECGSCAHRPDCGGGCLAASWVAAGRVDGVNCELPYFETHGKALLQRRWATAVTSSPEEAAALIPPMAVDTPRHQIVSLRVINA